MSLQQYFSETEAVVQVLSEWVEGTPETEFAGADSDSWIAENEEFFTAVWQAAELLSRAYSVLLPMVQFEASKAALNLPDVEREKPKKKAHLYGADGKPL